MLEHLAVRQPAARRHAPQRAASRAKRAAERAAARFMLITLRRARVKSVHTAASPPHETAKITPPPTIRLASRRNASAQTPLIDAMPRTSTRHIDARYAFDGMLCATRERATLARCAYVACARRRALRATGARRVNAHAVRARNKCWRHAFYAACRGPRCHASMLFVLLSFIPPSHAISLPLSGFCLPPYADISLFRFHFAAALFHAIRPSC